MRSSEIHKSCMGYTRWESIVSQSLGVHHVPGTSLPVLLKQRWRVTHITSLVGFTSLWGEADNKQIENKRYFQREVLARRHNTVIRQKMIRWSWGGKDGPKQVSVRRGGTFEPTLNDEMEASLWTAGGRTFVGEYKEIKEIGISFKCVRKLV